MPGMMAGVTDSPTSAEPHGATPDDDGSDNEEDASTSGNRRGTNHLRGLIEWLVVIAASVGFAIVLRTFVVQSFSIPSESMESTLEIGDRLMIEKVSHRLSSIDRGDIVVFRRPPEIPGTTEELIKRVIGVGGDSVQGLNGTIYVNGEAQDEPYINEAPFGDFGPLTVPDDELFVMGDNRDRSLDSRVFGTISTDTVRGTAFLTFWPFDRIGGL